MARPLTMNRRISPSRWPWSDITALSCIVFLTMMVMWQRWTFDNWLARHDLLSFFLPWLGALGDRLRAGDIPALNPAVFSGTPFAGDPESGWMYLPAMLLFPFFSADVAYKLMIMLLLLIAGFTTYALCRVLRMSVLASLIGAVAFEFGPFLFGQTNCCTVGTMLEAFLPMAFLGVELALRSATWPARLSAWVISGFAISQIFAIWLGQGMYNALLMIAAWVVFRTLITPPIAHWNLKTRVFHLLTTGPAILILGLILNAAALLPRLAANAESNNPNGDYSNTPGAKPGGFLSLPAAIRRMVGATVEFRETSMWGVVFLLCLLGIFLMRRRSVIPFFLALAVGMPAVAMNAPVIAQVCYMLPRYEGIQNHAPARIMWVYALVPAMLAAAAANELPRLAAMKHKWWIIQTCVLLSILAGVAIRYDQQKVGAGDWYWITLVLATALVSLIAAAPRLRRWVRQDTLTNAAMVGLAISIFLFPNALDWWSSFHQPPHTPGKLYMWGNDAPTQQLIHDTLRKDDPGGAGEFLLQKQSTDQPFRFVAYGGYGHPKTGGTTYPDRRLQPDMIAILQNARPMRLHLETTQGYNPLQPAVYADYLTAINGHTQDWHYANVYNTGVNSPLLDMLNVRYVVVPASIPPTRDDIRALAAHRHIVFSNDQVVIYEANQPFERAWMVYDVRTDADGLTQLAQRRVNGRTTAFVKDGDVPALKLPADGAQATVSVTSSEPDGMELSVEQTGDGLLVVSEVYSENWKATVDGKDVDVVQTDHALVGIPMTPGSHKVTLTYAPRTLTQGVWISSIGGIGSVAILGYNAWSGLNRRRRSSRRESAEVTQVEETL